MRLSDDDLVFRVTRLLKQARAEGWVELEFGHYVSPDGLVSVRDNVRLRRLREAMGHVVTEEREL